MLLLVLVLAIINYAVSTPTTKYLEDLKIVGGEDIDITDAPYQVSLLRSGRHLCGGTIIADDIIVSAAHCFYGGIYPNMYKIRVGSSYKNRDGKIYSVREIVTHPGFDFDKMDSDIAIIWLTKPLEFNDKIASIEMAEEDEEITDGDLTIVTGWGSIRENGSYREKLQRAMIPKVNEQICSDAYKPIKGITPQMLCAGFPEGGKDACQGDSGGPLVHNNKLAGVVSWGYGCARPRYPGVYAKVSALRKWLNDNIAMLKMKNILRM